MLMKKLDYWWNDDNADGTWEDEDAAGSVNKFVCECEWSMIIHTSSF